MSVSRKRRRTEQAAKKKSKSWTLADAFNESVRPYIDLVDSLRSSNVDQDVSLPSVVVIGDQSTGKSSVLEAISGVQLPRGTGIVTRCALELRLKKMKGKTADGAWQGRLRYLLPGEDPQERNLESPDEVGAAVREAQDAMAGDGKCVSEDGKIELEVSSPNVPDLTLIDLPGITRVPAPGQPPDIGDQIKRLIKKHIVKGETIILCVIPCPSDITTTEALVFAREVDPEGGRTLGVLTRADQTGSGEEKSIIDIVQQKSDVQLKLGCTVVKCRSQKDIEEDVSLEDALEAEKRFFRTHEVFQHLDPSTVGIEQLSVKLTRQLVDHIQACLPNLLKNVEKALKDTTDSLEQLGKPIPADKISYLVQALLTYGKTLNAIAKGEFIIQDDMKSYRHRFNEVRDCFAQYNQAIRNLCPGEEDLEKIEQLVQEQRGRELPGFENYGVFEGLAQETVKKFEKPALDCLNVVRQLVEKLYLDLAADQFKRFATLKAKVIQHVQSLFDKSYNTATDAIKTMINMEMWIFTSDPTYQSILNDLRHQEKRDTALSQRSTISYIAVPLASSVRSSETGFLTASDVAVDMAWSAEHLLGKLQGYFKVL
jgi:interferon-induced GTP-binding protein Mx1